MSSASPIRSCRKGKARIRTQISAAHSREDLEHAIQAFAEVKRELGV